MSWDTPVIHADLDAFYASVEILRDPRLRGKPVIVGGTSSRGVVTSASYEARRLGVASAMPTSRARRLCPNAVFIAPDFEAYTGKSHEVRTIFDSFSPTVEPLSLDEAFIDISHAGRLWPAPDVLAEELRRRVRRRSGLVVSVGVAPNKFLSKVASAEAKPDGMLVVASGEVEDFLHPLPVERLWGVGVETLKTLHLLGLRRIGDVAAIPTATLTRALGSLGSHIATLARGADDRRVVADPGRKSLAAEETFDRDLTATDEFDRALLVLADRVSSRLRSKGISGRTITLKVRFSDFRTITRSKSLSSETDGCVDIFAMVRELLERALGAEPERKRVRLLGISVSGLCEHPPSEQLVLGGESRWREAEQALDAVRERFGSGVLAFASTLRR